MSVRILLYGAGVIGQVYAARLFHSGADVTLLARGNQYEELKKTGIHLYNVMSEKKISVQVPLISSLTTKDEYDLIIITVRLDQLDSVIQPILNNTRCKRIMLMLNNPQKILMAGQLFPDKKIWLGFPGIGGYREGNQIKYTEVKQQTTTFGEADGTLSVFTISLKKIFESAGFKVSLEKNMQAWLVIHAVFISAASAAIALQNKSSVQLGQNKKALRDMIKSIREGFKACNKLGFPIIPPNLKTIFVTMPTWFSVLYWAGAMKGKIGTLTIEPHLLAAQEEMQLLARQVLEITQKSELETPALTQLLKKFILRN